jgi:transcriptional regulator of nitric oxide reductase
VSKIVMSKHMPNKPSNRCWHKSVLSAGLLLVAVLFDGGSMLDPVLKKTGLAIPGFNNPIMHRGAQAANSDHTSLRLLKEVVPGADSFSDKEGQPPVYKAYRTDPDSGERKLIGYAFVSADVPPEPNGFSGPIDSLVGIDLEGTIVGLRVVYYKESLRATWGDFLSWPGFQEQYIGMTARNKFLVGRGKDIDGIAKATISSKAMARGIRQSLRAVTKAYID